MWRVVVVGDLAVEHALEHPQHVDGRQDHAEAGDDDEARIPLEGAEHDQELADEAVHAGQADRRERDEERRRRQPRDDLLDAAVLADEARVAAIREHPDEAEQAAGADAVRQHLIHRALHALQVHRRRAEHDEAHVADRRVGHQLLHVRLHHRHQRAVDDGDHRQDGERRREVERGLGEERKREPHQAVAAHLQHHAGQNHRARRGRLDVRVGQPGVEREERHLDRKGQREGEEEPVLRGYRNVELIELQQVEAVAAVRRLVQPRQADDGDEHQDAAGHRVEDELHRRVDAAVVAPDADEEIHRDEDEVPEHVEQEDVERGEDAEHRRLEEQHEDRELLDLLVDALPRRQQRNRREERRSGRSASG